MSEKEGQLIEPPMLLPILPLVLVNGFHGIGTGWSTSGPNFGVLEVTKLLRNHLGYAVPSFFGHVIKYH